MSQTLPEVESSDGRERRRYERYRVSVSGRLMMPSGAELVCSVEDISESGIALGCDAHPEASHGDKVIVYLDNLGRFEGRIVRIFADGFAIETKLPANQRRRVTERIDWLKQNKEGSERRAFARCDPDSKTLGEGTHMTVQDGVEIPCKVVDVSVTGAHLRTDSRPIIGMHVNVGRMLGRVVRHTNDGVAIEFLNSGNIGR